jgi:hypothetical protein
MENLNPQPLEYRTAQPSTSKIPRHSLWNDPFILLSSLGAAATYVIFGLPRNRVPARYDEKFGFWVGSYFGAFLMFYLITLLFTWFVCLFVANKKVIGRSMFIPLVLILALVTTLGSRLNQARLNRMMVAAQQRQLNDQLASVIEDPTNVGPTTNYSKTIEQAGGQRTWEAILLETFRAFLADTVEARNKYDRKIVELVGEGLLDPVHFSSVAKLAELKKTVNSLRALLAEYEENALALFTGYVKRIEAIDLPEKQKAGIVAGFKKGVDNSRGRFEDRMNVSRQSCVQILKLVEFMESRLGRYVVQDGQIIFDEADDANQYNSQMTRIEQLFDQEAKLIEEAQQKSRESLKAMKGS